MSDIEYNGSSTVVAGSDGGEWIVYSGFWSGASSSTVTANMKLFGLGGDDGIVGADGNDQLFGGAGNDLLHGGNGCDVLFGGEGNDKLFGDAGNDTLQVETGFSSFGNDTLSGGDGFDRVSFQTASILEVNGHLSSFSIGDPQQGVSISLGGTGAALVGSIGDMVGGLSIDEGVILANPLGTIADASGKSNFGDIEEFDLTSHTDIFNDSSASHTIRGGGGNDYIEGGGGADIIDGGSGNDTAMYLGSSAAVSVSLLDFGNGGSGSGGDAQGDKLFSIENVFGSGFNDFLLGNASANVLHGEAGNDTMIGGFGNDTLSGGDGNDQLRGGLGNDSLDGGAGVDTADLSDWSGVSSTLFSPLHGTINLSETGAGTATLTQTTFSGIHGVTTTTIETDTLISIENVTGSNVSESITGNSADNVLNGSGGDDVLDGSRGNDTLIGGDGNDTASYASLGTGIFAQFSHVEASLLTGTANATQLSFGAGGLVTIQETDTLSGIENLTGGAGSDTLTGDNSTNTLNGGAGNDVLRGMGGGDHLVGGDGSDTADYASSLLGVTVDLALNTAHGGDAEGDSFQSIENLNGSFFADTLNGDGAANILTGNGGNDTIHGGGGNDVLTGGAGGDVLDGGDGFDFADYHTESSISIDLLNHTAGGTAAGDTFISIEAFLGGFGNNTMKGDANDNTFEDFNGGNNTLVGRDGNDTLLTGSGLDTLQGGAGNDTLSAGGGNDLLRGGTNNDSLDGGDGNDTLTGGLDSDTFTFSGLNSGHDEITDYQQGLDHIVMNGTAALNFADLTILGNGTNYVTIEFDGQSIDIMNAHNLTLTSNDFLFI